MALSDTETPGRGGASGRVRRGLLAADPSGSVADPVVTVEAQTGETTVTGRVVGVDILRGFCALAVMAYHFGHWSGFQTSGLLDGALQKAGIYGVEAFFVISGFSLYIASAGRDFSRWGDVRTFLIRRSLRVLPLLFVATVATAMMMWVGGHGVSGLVLLANFALIPIVLNPALALATGAWSLGVEWGFYLLFPLLMLFRARLAWVLGVGCVGLAVYASILRPDDLASQSTLYVSTPNHFAFFVAGMALGKWRPRAIGTISFAAAVVLVLAGFVFV